MENFLFFLSAFMPTLAFIAISVGGYFLWKKVHSMGEKTDDSQAMLLMQSQLQEIVKANQDLKLSNEQLKHDLSEKLNEKLGQSQKAMTDSVQTQFQESQKLIKEITGELGEVKKGQEKVAGFTEQLQQLQDILQNSKQRGALGEYFLKSTIENILPANSYEFQYSFKNKEIVDAVIKLPEAIIPIDAKFSLENYNNYVSETNDDKREVFRKIFREDLKKRVMETAKYIRPNEGTMDFAFMFIPSEGIYYDLLTSKIGASAKDESAINAVNSQNFLEYAFREKRVIVVSPTTLLAYLQTVMQGLKALQIEKQATHIIKRVGDLQKHLVSYETHHTKLGNTLSTAVNHYDASGKKLKQISNSTLKITGEGEVFEPQALEKPKSLTDEDDE